MPTDEPIPWQCPECDTMYTLPVDQHHAAVDAAAWHGAVCENPYGPDVIARRHAALVAAAEAIFDNGDVDGERPSPLDIYRRYQRLRAALDGEPDGNV